MLRWSMFWYDLWCYFSFLSFSNEWYLGERLLLSPVFISLIKFCLGFSKSFNSESFSSFFVFTFFLNQSCFKMIHVWTFTLSCQAHWNWFNLFKSWLFLGGLNSFDHIFLKSFWIWRFTTRISYNQLQGTNNKSSLTFTNFTIKSFWSSQLSLSKYFV